MTLILLMLVIVFVNWFIALSFAWWALNERERYRQELRRVREDPMTRERRTT